MDFVRRWSEKTEIGAGGFIGWLDIVAVIPTSVWRVLSQAELLSKWNGKPSKKGTGFEQPLVAHQHWHIDVSYINISGTFYYPAASSMAAGGTSSTGIRGS